MSICVFAKRWFASGRLAAWAAALVGALDWAAALVRQAPAVRRPTSDLNLNIAAAPAVLIAPHCSRSHHRPPSLSVCLDLFLFSRTCLILCMSHARFLLLFNSSTFLMPRPIIGLWWQDTVFVYLKDCGALVSWYIPNWTTATYSNCLPHNKPIVKLDLLQI